jgi:hypothetical protein
MMESRLLVSCSLTLAVAAGACNAGANPGVGVAQSGTIQCPLQTFTAGN